MQKIIYIILGLVLLAGLVFGILYINGNYNDKSKVSESFDSEKSVTLKNKAMEKENDMVKKDVPKEEAVKVNTFLKSGTFNKIDSVHNGTGEVKVTSDENYYYLNFQNNFSVANGPDLYVYLSSRQEYKNIAVGGVDTGRTLNIGKLKNISGAQVYKVSKEEFEKYSDSVIIWCKDFGVQFSRAELK